MAIVNLLVIPFGIVSGAVLMLALSIGFTAWRLGIRSVTIQSQFRLGINYSLSANVGKWLGGLEFLIAFLFAAALLVPIVMPVSQ